MLRRSVGVDGRERRQIRVGSVAIGCNGHTQSEQHRNTQQLSSRGHGKLSQSFWQESCHLDSILEEFPNDHRQSAPHARAASYFLYHR